LDTVEVFFMEKTGTSSYSPPIDQLLAYGEPAVVDSQDWPDYLALGLGPQHIPDLIRMATDPILLAPDREDLAGWAPIHAWRALGELRAEATVAAEHLLALFEIDDTNDWALEELPEVYAMIGLSALPALNAYIADPSHNHWGRITALEAVQKIATDSPETRPMVVTLLMEQMERMEHLPTFEEDDYELNGWFVSALTQLKAHEALPLIERAFAAERVDLFASGSWEFVQSKFGLITEEEAEQRRAARQLPPSLDSRRAGNTQYLRSSSKSHKKLGSQKKIKRVLAQQSKKKNRKR
jgi:hypothetical protein